MQQAKIIDFPKTSKRETRTRAGLMPVNPVGFMPGGTNSGWTSTIWGTEFGSLFTFASWALAAGKSAEWVARTLGHVNTVMV